MPEDNLVANCKAWLDIDAKAEQLADRWSNLETLAVRQFDWLNLSPSARRTVPMTMGIDQIRVRLEATTQVLETSLLDLRTQPAKDMAGAIDKVMVAVRPFLDKPDEEYQFLVDAVATLAALAPIAQGR